MRSLLTHQGRISGWKRVNISWLTCSFFRSHENTEFVSWKPVQKTMSILRTHFICSRRTFWKNNCRINHQTSTPRTQSQSRPRTEIKEGAVEELFVRLPDNFLIPGSCYTPSDKFSFVFLIRDSRFPRLEVFYLYILSFG